MSGGGLGGVLGATLGTVAGAALAPETGGLSLAIPMAMGAAGGAFGGGVGSAVTGQGNPWSSALSGGIGGAASGLMSGALSGLMGGADSATSAVGADMSAGAGVDASGAGVQAATGVDAASGAFPSGGMSYAPGSFPSGGMSTPADFSGASGFGGAVAPSADAAAPSSGGGSLGGNPSATPTPYMNANGAPLPPAAAKDSGGLSSYLLPAGLALGAAGAFMPSGSNPVNTSAATAAQNNFNQPLPQYKYTSTQAPPSGSWYTYGQRPQAPMITNTVTPLKHGGLAGYARGGMVPALQIPMSKMPVRKLADGGLPMNAPMQAPAQPAMLPRPAGMPQPQMKPNPAQQAAQFAIGQKIGAAVRKHIQGKTPDGMVAGGGKGQDDAIPAKLSQNEYVVPADVTSMLGDGSSNAGGKALDQMVHAVRAHKTSKGAGFPPKAKAPTAYIKGKKP